MQSHTITTDIPYTTTNPHPRQVLDLYQPTSTTTSPSTNPNPQPPTPTPTPTPLIIYIHGGAFKFGSKESRLLPLRQVHQNNYTIAALNYRRSGEALFPAMIVDCKSAIRFLKSADVAARYNIDPSRVVVWGESAGGHAAAFLGVTSRSDPRSAYDEGDHLDVSSAVAGVVDYYRPTDFLRMDEHLPEGFRTYGDAESPESLYLGGKISEVPERVREADPCSYVEGLAGHFRHESEGGERGRQGGCPSFFVAHGTGDRIVPEYMSKLLVETLETYGVDVEYLPVEGADHVFEGITEEQREELDRRTDAFLRRVFDREV